jgi:hypothetical protein
MQAPGHRSYRQEQPRLPVLYATSGWASLLPSFSRPWCIRPSPATPEKRPRRRTGAKAPEAANWRARMWGPATPAEEIYSKGE